jgi:malate dehydrogenase (oxaloacetate-decarboxylating)(NADP+)
MRFGEMIAPTLGGINLEDIKAPECFYIEPSCRSAWTSPSFTMISTALPSFRARVDQRAGRSSASSIDEIKIVLNGAGAASIATADLYVALGAKRENFIMCDTKGVIYQGRTAGMNEYKEKYAIETDARTLEDASRARMSSSGCRSPTASPARWCAA